MKYNDWLTEWLELYVKPSVKIRTYEKYRIMACKHIAPNIGEYELNELTAEVLQRFVVKLSQELSGSYINSVIVVLRKSLNAAVNTGVTRAQYADKIARPKTKEKKTECFTSLEQRKIERAVFASKKQRLFGIVLCLYTGLRLGELLSLQWSDVNLQKGLLSVNRSCHYGKDENGNYSIIEDTPKTQNSVRQIPIPKQIIPYLKQMKSGSKCCYIINRNGRQVTPRAYQYEFEALLKKQNIPHRGFHSLRHTFATRAIECGVDVRTLSEILGHKNPTITLSRYAHSLMEHKCEMMNKIGKMLVTENNKK